MQNKPLFNSKRNNDSRRNSAPIRGRKDFEHRNKSSLDNNEVETPKKKPAVYLKEYTIQHSIELLEFLLKTITNTSRNNVKSLLSHKKILVDGVVTTQFDYKLQPKQKVQISKDPIRKQGEANESLDIIYEDNEIIVINKPSGLLSIATDKENEQTAYRMLMDYVRKQDKHNRVFVVHRIDRDTSGVLMIAKSEAVQNMLQDDWNTIVTKRGYVAVVEGTFVEKQGTYESWLRETATHIVFSSEQKGDGKKSVTHYKVIKENRHYSMLEVEIDSGRKNQIRVQMNDHGHPVIGDKKYESKTDPIHRLGLHASVLEFTHPVTKKVMHFEAKVPGQFYNVFNTK